MEVCLLNIPGFIQGVGTWDSPPPEFVNVDSADCANKPVYSTCMYIMTNTGIPLTYM